MTTSFTPEQKLTLIKHLAGGKPADVVAEIMRATKAEVIDVARHHGYPDTEKLAWAADIMAKNIAEDGADFNPAPLAEGGTRLTELRPTPPPRPGDRVTVVQTDEVMAVLNGAKGHSSKRIQAAANKALDAIAKVRQLVVEDEKKHAERRKAEKARREARAEVDRLEQQLAEAKAKLRGKPVESAAAEDGMHPCLECPRAFGSAHALAVHRGRAHSEQVAS